MSQKCALVMVWRHGRAISFRALAVALACASAAGAMHWLGAPNSMESRLVPPKGIALETVDFSGVRGKGLRTLVLAPLRLARACWQSLAVIKRCARGCSSAWAATSPSRRGWWGL